MNISFGIYTRKDGRRYEYFVRKYKKGITEKEIMLEHNLIAWAKTHGLDIAAGLIPTKDGGTFVKIVETENGQPLERYFAIYEFLEGEDKYTWITPYLTDEEYVSMAEAVATMHNSTRDFDPQGLERVEPKIMEFLPTLPDTFKKFAEMDLPDNVHHEYYRSKLDQILAVIDRVIKDIPPEKIEKMPMNPIHCDIHPGNFKFADNKVVGVFDFDWSKIDLRLFDLCLALVYSCTYWDPEKDGILRLDKIELFLKAYQNKLKELGGLSPLNETELEMLPHMMQAANIYLINWEVTAYYPDHENLNVYEYLAYLQHLVKQMNFIEDHLDDLAQITKRI